MLFITWVAVPTDHPWFVYVLLASVLPLECHLIGWLLPNSQLKAVYMHAVALILVTLLCFIVWLDVSRGTPWFLFVFFALGLLFIAHCVFACGLSKFATHVYVFVDLNMLLFFYCIAVSHSTPWFIIPCAVWGVLLGLHYLKVRRDFQLLPPVAPTVADSEFVIDHMDEFEGASFEVSQPAPSAPPTLADAPPPSAAGTTPGGDEHIV
eukprot:TRINITY_DN7712_c0_g1_i2.p1 TRINITY_DN7712_c0_g1~~TRINITY_DN7712_c0_g1_i2.p1  ORF type:complete len:208 (-),score=65.40 TRINITY_DN7712_c0_g1_i2:85-708(-)